MLVGGHTGWQNFGDDCVRNDRETIVNGASSSGIFQIVHFAESQHESKDAFTVVEQDFP